MDNLTHTLVGLMLSRCGLDRGEKGTAAVMMLAANAPDIDAYPFFTDQLDYLEIHRGYTHALAFTPLVALLPLGVVWVFTKKRPSVYLWFTSILAILSHLMLDWTNVYGIRMLLPFSEEWLRLDITNVVDPIIWLILIACSAIPGILSLVSSEIGAKKTMGPKRAWAWLAIVALLGYEGVRWNSHQSVILQLRSLLWMDQPADAVYAFPDSFGTLNWRAIVEGETFVYEVPVAFNGEFQMRDAHVVYKIGHAPSVDAARTTRTFRVVESFNQVPFWRISPLVDETRVDLLDLRFASIRGGGGFTATAMVEPDGRIKDVGFGMRR